MSQSAMRNTRRSRRILPETAGTSREAPQRNPSPALTRFLALRATRSAASSGTYTVSGSKVTFFWNANGYDVSESFTVTNSGSSSEWRSDSNGTSTFLSMVFNVMSLSITLGKS